MNSNRRLIFFLVFVSNTFLPPSPSLNPSPLQLFLFFSCVPLWLILVNSIYLFSLIYLLFLYIWFSFSSSFSTHLTFLPNVWFFYFMHSLTLNVFFTSTLSFHRLLSSLCFVHFLLSPSLSHAPFFLSLLPLSLFYFNFVSSSLLFLWLIFLFFFFQPFPLSLPPS